MTYFKIWYLFFLIGGSIIPGCTPNSKKKSPNVLILFTDDQRYQTIHALGNNEVITPNMDRLVDMGITFNRAYIMGGTSGAVCMPSRAMLNTSRTLFHLKLKGAVIPSSDTMLPEVFKKEGYDTYGIGKWHNGRPAYSRAFTGGGKIFFGGMSNHLKVPVYDFDSTGRYPNDKKYTGDKFSSVLFADEAIRFLKGDHQGTPFYLYVAFTAPHDPRMAPKEFEDLYPSEKIVLPQNFMPKHPFDNGEMNVRDEKLAPWPRTPEIIRTHIAAYYAMITHLDKQIGRILDVLEETGQLENTIIVFAGDNGLALGQHGLMGKQNIYEHSVRVPLIFAGPGIPKNKKTDALCYLNDIYPTLCNLLDMPVPDTVEGRNLLPVFRYTKGKIRDDVFLAYRNFQRGIRTYDNWKLIKYNVKNRDTTQLFNLSQDPWELRNLAYEPAFQPKVEELTKRLIQYMHAIDDPMDLEKANWGKPKMVVPHLLVDHLAKGKKVDLFTPCSPKYPGQGEVSILTDGKHGSLYFNDGTWQGYEGNDMDAVVDMGAPVSFTSLSPRFFQNPGSWIFYPEKVEFLVSNDKHGWKKIGTILNREPQKTEGNLFHDFNYSGPAQKFRYIRIKANNIGVCPQWHPGAGGKAWIFCDEIVVR